MVGLLFRERKMARARHPGRAECRREYYHMEVGAANAWGEKGFGVQGSGKKTKKHPLGARFS
jgi:hypothetical protein